jgi:DNA-binding transcriptional regulator YhcF (GntR family)
MRQVHFSKCAWATFVPMVAAVSEWGATPFLDPRSEERGFLQPAHGLMRDIHGGRWGADEVLPGYRTLAKRLGMSRNTVMAAHPELRRERFFASTPGEVGAVADRASAHHRVPLAARDEQVRRAPAGMGVELPGASSPAPDELVSPCLALRGRESETLDVGWAARALKRGVAFGPGPGFAFGGGPVAGLCSCFFSCAQAQLEEGA